MRESHGRSTRALGAVLSIFYVSASAWAITPGAVAPKSAEPKTAGAKTESPPGLCRPIDGDDTTRCCVGLIDVKTREEIEPWWWCGQGKYPADQYVLEKSTARGACTIKTKGKDITEGTVRYDCRLRHPKVPVVYDPCDKENPAFKLANNAIAAAFGISGSDPEPAPQVLASADGTESAPSAAIAPPAAAPATVPGVATRADSAPTEATPPAPPVPKAPPAPKLAEAPAKWPSRLPTRTAGLFNDSVEPGTTMMLTYADDESIRDKRFVDELRDGRKAIAVAFVPRANNAKMNAAIALYDPAAHSCKGGTPEALHLCQNLVTLARHLKTNRGDVYFRPMSEMNYHGPDVPGREHNWALGVQGNTPESFAKAWVGLKKIFLGEGADQVKFQFDISVGHEAQRYGGREISNQTEMAALMKQIRIEEQRAGGIKSIQLVAAHTYSAAFNVPNEAAARGWRRQYSANVKTGYNPPPTFEMLAKTAMRFFANNGFGPNTQTPFVIGEVAIAGASDAQRARWISTAFQTADRMNISSMNYFDGGDRRWAVAPNSLAAKVLNCEIRNFSNPGRARTNCLRSVGL